MYNYFFVILKSVLQQDYLHQKKDLVDQTVQNPIIKNCVNRGNVTSVNAKTTSEASGIVNDIFNSSQNLHKKISTHPLTLLT